MRRGHPLPYGATRAARGRQLLRLLEARERADPGAVRAGRGGAGARAAARPALQQDGRRLARAGRAASTRGSSTASARPRPEAASAGALPMRFDSRRILIDPYSRSVAGLERWGEGTGAEGRLGRLRSRVIDEEFDWDGTRSPCRSPTRSSTSCTCAASPATRPRASRTRAPTAGWSRRSRTCTSSASPRSSCCRCTSSTSSRTRAANPLTGERLLNFWGYSPSRFFAPKAAYAVERARRRRGARVQGRWWALPPRRASR